MVILWDIVGYIRLLLFGTTDGRTMTMRFPGLMDLNGVLMATKKNLGFEMRGKKWKVKFVPDVVEAGYDYAGINKDTSAFVAMDGNEVVISDDLTGDDADSTILHEMLHVAAPRLSEQTILMLERHLYPVLKKNGLRFIR